MGLADTAIYDLPMGSFPLRAEPYLAFPLACACRVTTLEVGSLKQPYAIFGKVEVVEAAFDEIKKSGVIFGKIREG